jgi:3-deoxy-D-manno-octulosonic-acid transferase
MSLLLRAYRALSGAAFPFIRGRLERGHPTGFDERCGVYSGEKLAKFRCAPRESSLWLHSVSVGEVQAASPFVSAAAKTSGRAHDVSIFVSTVTETGAASAEKLIGSRMASHFYAPWDIPFIVKKACDAISSSIYVTVETEVWPNLLMELRSRGVPACLLNARLSDRTASRARLFRGYLRDSYDLFDLILARGEEDARRIESLGVNPEKIKVTGDCKIDAIIERHERASRNGGDVRVRPLMRDGAYRFVAGSTHEGEERAVLEAFREFKSSSGVGGSLLVIVPRHPERARGVMEMSRAFGSAALLSELGDEPQERPDAVIVDVIGVLFDLYATADAAFIGGSIAPKGGQNVLEPASWGVPILHGPHMEDFMAPTADLDAIGAASLVRDAGEMAREMLRLYGGGAVSRRRGMDYIKERSGAALRSWELVSELWAGRRLKR